ncbi:somatostatin receptor type 5-like [Lytechinus variegatus]|uniref:somatostatin receptor type 5-like n=1 Tax=Lytechinus variegatus TaxID=7654 RepID=UPI001BB2224D|nr:somatostatin receptor type 5-like [Lytechinus variegatus]
MNATSRMATTLWLNESYTTDTVVNHSCTFVLLEDECDLTILLSLIMFFVTLFNIIFGVIANVLVIGIILATKELWTIPSMYLANLAVADLMVLLFIAVLNCYEYYNGAFQPKEYHNPQKFVYYMEMVTSMATVAMMIALSVDRFFAIVYPLRSQKYRSKRTARRVCVAVWIFSFCFGGIYFLSPFEDNVLEAWKKPNSEYLIPFGAVLTYAIPLIIIFGCYTGIIYTIWKERISQERTSDSTRRRRVRQKHAVLRASVLVVALFALIQGFFVASFVWISFGGSHVEPSVIIIEFHVAQGLYHLNSLINPFLYALSHEKFYQSIWLVLSCSPSRSRRKKSKEVHQAQTRKTNGVGRPSTLYDVIIREDYKSKRADDVTGKEISTRL